MWNLLETSSWASQPPNCEKYISVIYKLSSLSCFCDNVPNGQRQRLPRQPECSDLLVERDSLVLSPVLGMILRSHSGWKAPKIGSVAAFWLIFCFFSFLLHWLPTIVNPQAFSPIHFMCTNLSMFPEAPALPWLLPEVVQGNRHQNGIWEMDMCWAAGHAVPVTVGSSHWHVAAVLLKLSVMVNMDGILVEGHGLAGTRYLAFERLEKVLIIRIREMDSCCWGQSKKNL